MAAATVTPTGLVALLIAAAVLTTIGIAAHRSRDLSW
ncbi:hypothetical protein JOF55_000036 [Haloactinomyces albus]|uniref:Uncharacterized protein n=1 Tax=Haloactinomyces albus TaxID=1352928 RepID=A0AAE3Z9P4_9ACTN|nr:hypothetical protein [Haloactinomyces albus]